jgi:3'(2'), 5'-bisphosphate nucleotidase
MSLHVPDDPRARLLPALESIARAAGELILKVYGTGFEVHEKSDASPVTVADEQAEYLITQALAALVPPWPVVAEEAAARGDTPTPGRVFWLVDPLDGTREFVARNGEFTVNIALVEDGVPVLGVVYLPVPDTLYAGGPGLGAWKTQSGRRQAIACREQPAAGATLTGSRWHGDDGALAAWLQGQVVAARVVAGSSLKFGLLACGQADVYPRFGRTMEWDTAAGDAVLRAAGGSVCDLQGRPLVYGKPGHENPPFIARGKPGRQPAEADS